jgi:hypothetical protein
MALENVLLPVIFTGGINQKTDKKRVLPGDFLLLQNAVFTKDGELIKRYGYDFLSSDLLSGGSIDEAISATGFLNELIQFGSNSLYTYSESSEEWINKGACYQVTNSNETVVRTTHEQSQPDLAINNDIALYAYKDSGSGGVNITVTDLKTGVIIQNNVNVGASGSLCPRVCAILGYIYVFYVVGNTIKVRILDIETPHLIGSELSLTANCASNSQAFNVRPNGNDMIICWADNSTSTTHVAYVTSDGALGTTAGGYPNSVSFAQSLGNCNALLIEETEGRILIFYADGTQGLAYTALNSDLTSYQSNLVIDSDVVHQTVRIAPYILSPTQAGIFYEKAGSTIDQNFVLGRVISISGGGGTSSTLLRSVCLASKAFQIGTTFLVNVIHVSTLQATYFTISSTGDVVSKILPTQAAGQPTGGSFAGVLPSVPVDSSFTAYFPALIKTKFISQGNTTFTINGLSLEKINFNPSSPFLSATMDKTLIISGGFIQAYDGNVPVELGFHFFPEGVTTSASTSGGSMGAGTYQYFVVYEWQDRNGDIHRSAPSIGKSVTTTGSTSSVALTIPTLRITKKSSQNALSDIVIAVYRTQANGTIAYKVTSVTSPNYNTVTADSVSITDGLADGSILSNEILYTTGGVLENDAPPSASLVDVNKNRVLLAGLEDPYVFSYSKQRVAGEGISFSQLLTVRVNSLGGGISTIKFMDDNIVIFKPRYIYYMAGRGPDDTGSNNDFSDPILVTSDAGCDNPDSCVLTPIGLMYQSKNGIYLLDRALNNSYIGQAVQDFNNETITSAVLVSDDNEVRFTTNNDTTLVYSYIYNRWSVFTNHGGIGAGLWKGESYFYVTQSGQARVENKSVKLDDGIYYPMTIKTGWLKPSSTLQGYQRVRHAFFSGDYLSAHKLRVQIAYDYEEFFSQSSSFDATTVVGPETYGAGNYGDDTTYGGLASGVEQFRISLNKQKCQAILFQIDDVQNGSYGEGYTLSEILLAIGLKAGGMRLPATKKIG